MKRRLMLLLLTGLFSALGGCSLLTSSLFPAYLSLTVDSIDLDSGNLKGLLGDPLDTQVDLTVLNNGFSGDVLFLVVRRNGGPERLAILGTDPLGAESPPLSQDDLNAFVGLAPGLGSIGRLRMIDDSLGFVVGNFVVDTFSGTILENWTVLAGSAADHSDVGFAIPIGNKAGWDPGNYILRSRENAGVWYLNVAYRQPPPTPPRAWDGPQTDYLDVHRLTAALTGELRVEAVYYSDDDDGLFLAMRRYDRIRVIFLASATVPGPGQNFFTNNFPIDILDYPHVELEGVAEGAFHLTADGVVIRTEDGQWERYKSGDKLTDSLEAPDDTEYYEEAFSPKGDYYYLVDKAARRLYKLKTWW